MSYPDIAQALAAAHRADLLRAADGHSGTVMTRKARRQRKRLVAWLDGQRLGHRRAPVAGTAACVAGMR